MKRRRSDDDDQPEQFETGQSSPSAESSSPANEGDMADTETDSGYRNRAEAGPSQGSSRSGIGEPSSLTAPPPAKKKRTRTLTTPHQSAVLHALLAQNQRQKARRPGTRTHEGQGARSDLLRHASGPYGVHIPGTVLPPPPSPHHQPSVQSSAGSASYSGQMYPVPMPGPSSGSGSIGPYYDAPRSGARISGGIPQLSGPGVPGSSTTYQSYTPTTEDFDHFPPPPQHTRSEYPPHLPPHSHPSPESWALSGGRRSSPPAPSVYAPHRELARNLPSLALDEPYRLARLPPLESAPPRHWSHIDLPPESPTSYLPIGIASTPRPHTPLTILPRASEHPILPRLRIPTPPQARSTDDRILPPLAFPPPSAFLSTQSTSSFRNDEEHSPASAQTPGLPPSTTRESHVSTLSHRGSMTPPEPFRDPGSLLLSARHGGLQLSPLSLRAPQRPATGSHDAQISPIASSPTVSRSRRFDPVRAAISGNESRGSTPSATTEPQT
ncbi:hypothetical protein K488DRAFT_90713 [Vararia minispora EC-137]|uniref:Uncharacterized protein n=1 Tax=Vararia minispora EC-137 TaxID=1314806 RepID=A0ACB8Q7N8_9AGAM|nr:hypothetical protein K488DRAFT_90713 [Vararia minispora EC-137]